MRPRVKKRVGASPTDDINIIPTKMSPLQGWEVLPHEVSYLVVRQRYSGRMGRIYVTRHPRNFYHTLVLHVSFARFIAPLQFRMRRVGPSALPRPRRLRRKTMSRRSRLRKENIVHKKSAFTPHKKTLHSPRKKQLCI